MKFTLDVLHHFSSEIEKWKASARIGTLYANIIYFKDIEFINEMLIRQSHGNSIILNKPHEFYDR